MNTKRGFIPVIIGIIVVVILVVGAIIYQNSTKTETHNYATHQTNQIVPAPLPLSDWQTYISESANFQIKYPEGWETAVYGALPGNIIVEFAPKNFKAQTKLAVGPISITEHRFQSKGLNSYLNQFKTSDIKEILINNIPAKEVNGEYFHATFHGIYIELPNSQNFLEIVDNIKNEIGANRLSSEVAASLDNIFDQMLSTFKFTDSQVDTSEWKIYHNDKYGFEIKYPARRRRRRAGNATRHSPPNNELQHSRTRGAVARAQRSTAATAGWLFAARAVGTSPATQARATRSVGGHRMGTRRVARIRGDPC